MKKTQTMILMGALLLTGIAGYGGSSLHIGVHEGMKGNADTVRVKKVNENTAYTAEELMSEVKAQITDEQNGMRDIRFVVAVKGSYDEENGQGYVPGNYGFKVAINGTEKEVKATKYYNSVYAGEEGYANAISSVTGLKSVDEFAGKEGYFYFIALTVENVPSASYDTDISITPFVEIDGSSLYGTEKVVSVGQFLEKSILIEETLTGWVGDAMLLTPKTTGNVGTLLYSVSDEDRSVCTVDGDGQVALIGVGSATVTIASSLDPSVYATVRIVSKDTIVETDYRTDTMDYSSVRQDDPVIRTKADLGTNVNAFARFRGVEGKVYMASATAKVSATSSGDTWSRIAIGHTARSSDSIFHGWCLSPGQNDSMRKQVAMNISASGDVLWGNLTNNSQVWNSSMQKKLDFSSVRLTSIRQGENYYYFVNDELVWMENRLFTDFNETDSIPTIHAASAEAEFSSLSATTDENRINAYLQEHSGNGKMYAYNDDVILNEDGTEITFSNADYASIKDNYAATIGDAFLLPAGKEATVEFDVTFKSWGTNAADALVALTLWNNGKANGDCRSACLGYQSWGMTGWNHNADFPGIGAKADLPAPVELDTVYHVSVTRLMSEENDSQDLSVAISSITDGWTWGWNTETGSRGDCQIRFGAQNCTAVIGNISVRIAE